MSKGPVAGSVGIEGGVVSGVINLESLRVILERQAGDHAMKTVTTTPELLHATTESNSHLFDDWFDPIEAGVRDRVRELIEEMIRSELDAVLSRPRYGRRAAPADGSDAAPVVTGHRHGSRVRTLTGTFGKAEIAVPRARLNTSDGKTTEWKSQALRKYQRRTLAADALIAGAYLAGTNTRRVRRALHSVFGGEVGKDTVSRVWRKVKGDWDAWKPSPTAWRKPAIGSSPSRVRRRANGVARALQTRSNGFMRSSSAGSRRRPCCHRQTPPPSYSGHCLLPDRSTCEKSMAGRPWPRNPSISNLISPHNML